MARRLSQSCRMHWPRSLLIAGGLLSLGLRAQSMPDFSLTNVNPNAVRGLVAVSPRDYRLQVSAYYFGSAG